MDRAETKNRRIWLIAGVLLLAWCVYLYLMRPGAGMGPPDLSDPGLGAVDYRWTLEDLDGKKVDFEAFRGKTVFLNQWATWCPPCVAELPSIERLAGSERLKHVAFLAVSNEDRETVRRFVQSRNLRIPVFVAPDPPAQVLQSDAIPATFLLAPDGRIRARQIGSARWDDPSVISFLESLKP